MEMDVVLRTVLRHFTIETTAEPDEKWHSRGVAFTPKRGGRVTVRRRKVSARLSVRPTAARMGPGR
jgi:cytochrome P450 family 138